MRAQRATNLATHLPDGQFFTYNENTTLQYRNFETNIPRKGISESQSQFPLLGEPGGQLTDVNFGT
jgi:hypothetical protein